MSGDPQDVLTRFMFPTVTQWNRLEGRPRAREFGGALKAEVRDALWMVSRQWQLGELKGDDAGSPVSATAHTTTGKLARFRAAAGPLEELPPGVALEAYAEKRPIVFTRGGSLLHLDLRVEIGRRWRMLLALEGLEAYEPAYRAAYQFVLPPEDRTAAEVYGHPEVWQQLAALAGRAIDGGELYLHLAGPPPGRASDRIALADPAHGAALDALGERLTAWFDSIYLQARAGQDAWRPPRLEYDFACAGKAGGRERVLGADGWGGGQLDWYAFDEAAGRPSVTEPAGAETATTRSMFPSSVSFAGMPQARWWKLEDSKVNFPRLEPTTTDLAKLLLMEFALVYGNDWLLLPLRLPVGSMTVVRGLLVTNSFGERFWIDPSGRGASDGWHAWEMYTLSAGPGGAAGAGDRAFFLAQSTAKVQEGEPLEEMYLLRDEMANMVWALESRVPLATGSARPGAEVAAETLAYHRRLIGPAPESTTGRTAPLFYEAMTSVPENWIPFVPVRVAGSSREIQLQRGGMRRTLEGDPLPPQKIEPLTSTLREGLDRFPRESFYVHEEEVPRAGVYVTKAFHRARASDGRVWVWLGMRKETGRGEGTSNLGFDQLSTVPATSHGAE